jgi:hypothetical protein
MLAAAAPDHVVKVSGEFRCLVAAARLHGPSRRTIGDADDAGRWTSLDRPEPATEAPWVDVLLRRDGARPLKLRALLLCDEAVAGAWGRAHLRIFASAEGRAVAQIAYLPDETLPARPVFRAAAIETAEDLHRFLADTGADLCFATGVARPDGLALLNASDRLRLTAVLPGLSRTGQISSHSSEGFSP